MKESEAIKNLRTYAYMEAEKLPYCMGQTFDAAINALKKQMPKKVINRCMFCECPTCGNVEIQSSSYCCDCGQKLDWSEEE